MASVCSEDAALLLQMPLLLPVSLPPPMGTSLLDRSML